MVEAVTGPTEKTRIRAGDVIIAVEDTNLTSMRQFREIVTGKQPGAQIALLVRRGDASLYVAVQVSAS